MRRAPFAKALTRHSYQMGVPPRYVVPVYLVVVMLLTVSGLRLWPLVAVAVVWHIYAKIKFERDEFFLAYFLNALLYEKEHLEP